MQKKLQVLNAIRNFSKIRSQNKTTRKKMPLLRSITTAIQQTHGIFSTQNSRVAVRYCYVASQNVDTNVHFPLFHSLHF